MSEVKYLICDWCEIRTPERRLTHVFKHDDRSYSHKLGWFTRKGPHICDVCKEEVEYNEDF